VLSLSLTYEANETDAEKPVRARSAALPGRVVATHATRAGGFGRDERPGSALPSTTYRGIGTRAATHVARSVAGYCFELLRRRGVEVAPRPRDDARREGGPQDRCGGGLAGALASAVHELVTLYLVRRASRAIPPMSWTKMLKRTKLETEIKARDAGLGMRRQIIRGAPRAVAIAVVSVRHLTAPSNRPYVQPQIHMQLALIAVQLALPDAITCPQNPRYISRKAISITDPLIIYNPRKLCLATKMAFPFQWEFICMWPSLGWKDDLKHQQHICLCLLWLIVVWVHPPIVRVLLSLAWLSRLFCAPGLFPEIANH
jgi:hypothetical protein